MSVFARKPRDTRTHEEIVADDDRAYLIELHRSAIRTAQAEFSRGLIDKRECAERVLQSLRRLQQLDEL
jgi:hypothetical protein